MISIPIGTKVKVINKSWGDDNPCFVTEAYFNGEDIEYCTTIGGWLSRENLEILDQVSEQTIKEMAEELAEEPDGED